MPHANDDCVTCQLLARIEPYVSILGVPEPVSDERRAVLTYKGVVFGSLLEREGVIFACANAPGDTGNIMYTRFDAEPDFWTNAQKFSDAFLDIVCCANEQLGWQPLFDEILPISNIDELREPSSKHVVH